MPDQLLATRLRMVANHRTNRQVAETLGVNTETVRRYLTGTSPPSAAFLAAFCKTYGVEGTWLLLGEGQRTPEEAADRVLTQAGIQQVIESLGDRLRDLENRLAGVENGCRATQLAVDTLVRDKLS